MFPNLFRRLSTGQTKENNAVTETVRTLIDARFDRLEEKVRCVEREWADVYDKIMLLYDRTRKRIAAAKKASNDETTIEPVQTIPLTRDDILRRYEQQNGGK